jgi:hypothetical protein
MEVVAMLRRLVLAAVMLAPWCAWAADVNGTITILEGDAFIYRGASRVYANEGVRLESGDIVETSASGFMQVELTDLSVVQFGPATRALINNASTGRPKPERWIFVMNGWCKVTGSKAAAADGSGFEVRTRSFAMPANAGIVVFVQMPGEATLFVERGDIKLIEDQMTGSPTSIPLKSGDYYRRKAASRGAANPGATEAFSAGMPRVFRDSLPLRLDRYRNQEVQPKEASDFVYADVEPWLNAEPWLRRPFVQRWRAKARNPAFRTALVAGLAAHPEWDPILFPEKYKKKEKPVVRAVRAPGAASEPVSLPAPARPAGVAASSPSAQ